MKVSRLNQGWSIVCGLMLAGLFLAGCKSGPDRRFAEIPGIGGAAQTGAGASAAPAAARPDDSIDRIRVGDTLLVTFSDLPMRQEPVEDRVRDDGTIILIENLSFKAADKARGELEREIHDAYVPKYYKKMTVSVTPQKNTQFYYVDGEVKRPDRQVYIGRLTVLKAIASANGFTDFAHKTAVVLTRADGRTVTVNTIKAQKEPKLDLEVYPGDKIWVPRKGHPFQR